MGKRKSLLGWDLGAGFGYCLQLREVATALAAAGHEPVVALRSLEHVHRLFADCYFPVLQAPWVTGRLAPGAVSRPPASPPSWPSTATALATTSTPWFAAGATCSSWSSRT